MRPKKPFPMKEFVKALLAVAVVAGVAIAFLTHEKRQAAAYEEALDALSRGKYISAEQSFSDLSGYRDAEPLSVYCKYMNIYQNATEYEGGLWELSKIRLRYNMDLQKQVDALIFRVERYSAAEKAADAAKKEAQRKEQYSGQAARGRDAHQQPEVHVPGLAHQRRRSVGFTTTWTLTGGIRS